jgi:drug/metabolite transporter (DMT)-like permease
MLAFAANSLFCRAALDQQLIDPAAYAITRAVSAALLLVALRMHRPAQTLVVNWGAASLLAAYLVCFTLAYVRLGAATGALVLFGAVQLTMFGAGLRDGERYAARVWAGLAIAAAGLVFLLLPGISAPDPGSGMLMVIAGVAWGGYSLLGRNTTDPATATMSNFVVAAPLTLLACVWFVEPDRLTAGGVFLAVASGTAASALGYVVWYAALRRLNRSTAASVQLSVPVIAAFGGLLLLDESPTLRLAFATIAVLGGIWMTLNSGPARQRPGN